MPAPDSGQNAASPLMGITITDDTAAVANGQPLHYRVTIHNPTNTETPVTVRVTFSSATNLQAPDATIVANAVAWKNTLQPGSTRTYSVAGVASTSRPDLAATACVHLTADTPALTCATDHNTITTSRTGSRSLAWLASIALGLLAIAGSIWLHRKITPELLTPANASHGHALPEQQP